MTISRRRLQLCLGGLWLLDGGLQLQPYMFSASFSSDVIGSAGDGQASFVSAPINWLATTIGTHPLPWNLAFALTQIGIGLGLLIRRTSAVALAASIAWGLGVWYLGEGLGGLTGPSASLLTGAPGAALLYAVLSVAAWPARSRQRDNEMTAPPHRWLPIAWATYWVGGSLLQVKNGPTQGPDLAATLAQSANNAPGWLRDIDFSLARSANHLSHTAILVLLLAQALVGVLALAPPPVRTVALWLGATVAVGYWIVGQQLGQLVTGRATDPNTGLLVVLLAAATRASYQTWRLRVGSRSKHTTQRLGSPPARIVGP